MPDESNSNIWPSINNSQIKTRKTAGIKIKDLFSFILFRSTYKFLLSLGSFPREEIELFLRV
jgi:hypothetical protein